jgi:hypothetical protein
MPRRRNASATSNARREEYEVAVIPTRSKAPSKGTSSQSLSTTVTSCPGESAARMPRCRGWKVTRVRNRYTPSSTNHFGLTSRILTRPSDPQLLEPGFQVEEGHAEPAAPREDLAPRPVAHEVVQEDARRPGLLLLVGTAGLRRLRLEEARRVLGEVVARLVVRQGATATTGVAVAAPGALALDRPLAPQLRRISDSSKIRDSGFSLTFPQRTVVSSRCTHGATSPWALMPMKVRPAWHPRFPRDSLWPASVR